MVDRGGLTMAQRLAPAISGPNTTAVCAAIERVFEDTVGVPATELLDALDTRPLTWTVDRPLWHLTLLEREAGIVPPPDAVPRDRYRAVRMRDVGRWSQGQWADLLRLAAAWLGVESENINPDKVRVYAWPLTVVYLFHPNVLPSGTNLDLFIAEVRATIQDVAGYGIAVGLPGLLFTFDIGPGFDMGLLGDIVFQEG
jgi:hypothetical protein